MRINLTVIANAKKELIEKLSDDTYRIKVCAFPEKGKANRRVVELLSGYFGVRKQDIKIISGGNSRHKIIEIERNE